MRKNLRPVMGTPAETCLEEIRAGKLYPNSSAEVAVKQTVALVNIGVCMTEGQVRVVRSWFDDIRSSPFGEPHVIASVINTFRLGCENCLNERCGQVRSVAIEEVRARAEEWAKTEVEGVSEVCVAEVHIRSFISDGAVANLLLRNDIKTVTDLLKRSESDLMGIIGFGRRSLTKVKRALAGVELSLRESDEVSGLDTGPKTLRSAEMPRGAKVSS